MECCHPSLHGSSSSFSDEMLLNSLTGILICACFFRCFRRRTQRACPYTYTACISGDVVCNCCVCINILLCMRFSEKSEVDPLSPSVLLALPVALTMIFSGINFCGSYTESTNFKLRFCRLAPINYLALEVQYGPTPGSPYF